MKTARRIRAAFPVGGAASSQSRCPGTDSDPVGRKIEPESMDRERIDETVVCGGVYKN